MRRAVFVGTIFLLSAALPAAGAPTSASFSGDAPDRVRMDRDAEASWLVPTKAKGRFTWYGVLVETTKDTEDPTERRELIAIRGKCRVHKGEDFTLIGCSGMGRGHELAESEFTMVTPALGAELDATIDDVPYRVTWSSEPLATGLYQSAEFCMWFEGGEEHQGEGQGGGVFSAGVAEGQAFDMRFTSGSRYDYAYMMDGVMLTNCQPFVTRDSDGRYHLKLSTAS